MGPTDHAPGATAPRGRAWRVTSCIEQSTTPTAYVVTNGEYSDYRVIGVFSKQELADRCSSDVGGRVEEYLLNVPNKNDGRVYRVRHSGDGEIFSVDESWDSSYGGETVQLTGERGVVKVLARSEEHAVKIVADWWRSLAASTGKV